jgi:hypothetical protein
MLCCVNLIVQHVCLSVGLCVFNFIVVLNSLCFMWDMLTMPLVCTDIYGIAVLSVTLLYVRFLLHIM